MSMTKRYLVGFKINFHDTYRDIILNFLRVSNEENSAIWTIKIQGIFELTGALSYIVIICIQCIFGRLKAIVAPIPHRLILILQLEA
jgi:hypothetical protein